MDNIKNEVRCLLFLVFFSLLLIMLSVVPASAITAPAPGTFAYDIYDIAVLKILQGPIGFVSGVGAIALGAVTAIKSPMAAIPAVLSGAALLKADALVTSLGALF